MMDEIGDGKNGYGYVTLVNAHQEPRERLVERSPVRGVGHGCMAQAIIPWIYVGWLEAMWMF